MVVTVKFNPGMQSEAGNTSGKLDYATSCTDNGLNKLDASEKTRREQLTRKFLKIQRTKTVIPANRGWLLQPSLSHADRNALQLFMSEN